MENEKPNLSLEIEINNLINRGFLRFANTLSLISYETVVYFFYKIITVTLRFVRLTVPCVRFNTGNRANSV